MPDRWFGMVTVSRMLAWKLKNCYNTFKTKLLLNQTLMLDFRELHLQLQPSFCLSRIAQVQQMLTVTGSLIAFLCWIIEPGCPGGSVTTSSRDGSGYSRQGCTGLKSSMGFLWNYGEIPYLQAEKGLVKCCQLNILTPSSHPAGCRPGSTSGSA